jgi:hypothetical protein
LCDVNGLQYKASPALMPPYALIGTYHYHKQGCGNWDYAGEEEMILPNLADFQVMPL